MKLLFRALLLLLILCLFLPSGMAQAATPPYMPQYFYGVVDIGGIPAEDGTTVSAEIDNIPYASTTTFTEDGEEGKYLLKVPGEDPVEPGIQGGQPGDIVVFKVNAVVADSQPFEQGLITPLDLAIAGTPPVAEFSAIPLSGDEPLTVIFTDGSQNMINNPTWSWDFGDGGTSTDASPTHQFFYDDSYTVTLTVTTAYGSDSEVKTDYIVVADTEPVASFTADPTSGDRPLEVSFSDSSSSYDGITYEWDFSYDGVTFEVESTLQNPSHTYEAEGTYTVALTVTEADADSDMFVAENLITVGVPAPVAEFSASPLSGDEPLTVEFTDESLNMEGSPHWYWEFGDVMCPYCEAGSFDTLAEANEHIAAEHPEEALLIHIDWGPPYEPDDPNAQNPLHEYLQDGSYTVTLTVTTDEGSNTKVEDDYIVVADTEPVASFSVDPTSGDRPLEVSFSDSSSSYDGITYEWDFGDGGTSTEQNPSHTYEAEGTYTVALTVTEADADSDMIVDENLIMVTTPGDIKDPVIEYAWFGYPIGAESARPGEQFEVVAVVTDDTAVTLVELETPFDIFPLEMEEYEGIVIYWISIDVPEDTLIGTYELTLRAEDAAANEATQSLELEVVPVLTAYNVQLADGWNLISLPLIPDAATSENVTAGLSFFSEDLIRELWGDEAADEMMPEVKAIWYYDATGEYGTAGKWLYFEPATGLGDLPEIEDGKGYWVEVVSPVDEEVPPPILTVYGVEMVSGPTLPPTYAVVEGWNLIGFKETIHMHFSEYLSAVEGKYDSIYGYDPYEQYFYRVGEDGLDDMEPGAGYWIYMTDSGYIVP